MIHLLLHTLNSKTLLLLQPSILLNLQLLVTFLNEELAFQKLETLVDDTIH